MMLQARPSAGGRLIGSNMTRPGRKQDNQNGTAARSPPRCGYGSTGAAGDDRVSGCAVSDSLPSFETPCCAQLLRMRFVIAEDLILRRPRTEVGLARLRQP